MSNATGTIADFLLARIAEDEAEARFVIGFYPHSGSDRGRRANLDSIAVEVEPGRVLAECEAKRRIIERHTNCDDTSFGDPCADLRALAAVYADHPDYRDEWRP